MLLGIRAGILNVIAAGLLGAAAFPLDRTVFAAGSAVG